MRPNGQGATEQRDGGLYSLYRATRDATLGLAAPLSVEDQIVQSMPNTSPTKWHLGHTAWFFEKVVLEPQGVAAFDARFGVLFNSYYVAFGERHQRPERGLLSRPSLTEVREYRAHVDCEMGRLLESLTPERLAAVAPLVELGIAHEEQHQELILTDVLHALSRNPLEPAYAPHPQALALDAEAPEADLETRPTRFDGHPGGLVQIGFDPKDGFCFDNEAPRHKHWLEPFEIADRPVSVADVEAFIRDGGYRTASLWLSEGFEWVCSHAIEAPLYMQWQDGQLVTFGLHGKRVPNQNEPACHLSYYEADAIARYLGARLPTEAEWDVAAAGRPVSGNLLGASRGGVLHPIATGPDSPSKQLFGDVWEWTASSYEPYPGFVPASGALAEYNGKFMVNQRVLRGGSCLTPARHIRPTYRNFWHPDTRFQMSGLRLARSLKGG